MGFHNQIMYTCAHTFANRDTCIINTNANSGPSGTLGQNEDLGGFHGHSYIRSVIDLIGKMHTLEAFPALHSPGCRPYQCQVAQTQEGLMLRPAPGLSAHSPTAMSHQHTSTATNHYCHPIWLTWHRQQAQLPTHGPCHMFPWMKSRVFMILCKMLNFFLFLPLSHSSNAIHSITTL